MVNNPERAVEPLQVICVCGGFGFPTGNASAARISVIGKALLEAGFQFKLLHCGPSPMTINTQASGVHEGIEFEYMTSVRRPENFAARALVYLRAALTMTVRLIGQWPERRSRVVYLYIMDSPLGLYAAWICRLLGLPVVQELCEWLPGDRESNRFLDWLHRKPMFKLATGVLVISRFIEDRAREKRGDVNPDLLIHRLPAIVDTRRSKPSNQALRAAPGAIPEFVYCGTWLSDVQFLIHVFAEVKKCGHACRLKLVSGFLEPHIPMILDEAREHGIDAKDIIFTGYVDERTLDQSFRGATALLMPLWDDDRSRARIPNKITEYLASGRPVVTSEVGDLTEILTDGVSVYLAQPGNEREFAAKMIAILQNPDQASLVGEAGRQTCLAKLDYRAHIEELASFFHACRDQRLCSSTLNRLRTSRRIYQFVRNSLCGALSLMLIASGHARRARKRAFSEGVVTSIYFHKPNRRLFEGCVEWLRKHDYRFVTAGEVVEFVRSGKALPRGAVWLSFDDGCRELLTNVLPVIRRHKIPVTLFIPSGIVAGDGAFPWEAENGFERDAITVSELKEIARVPEVTIGSHTVNHTVTAGLEDEQLRYELGECRRDLEDWTGTGVRCFAYPKGANDGGELPLLAELGYELAATTRNAHITQGDNPFQVPRFSVADEISVPEAICNMVGVWRPLMDWIVRRLGRLRPALKPVDSTLPGRRGDLMRQPSLTGGTRTHL